ncbi:MAG: OB-fold domain-containing protein [Gammaproteobacteria bacterium]
MHDLGSILRIGVHVPKLRLAHAVIVEAMAWTSAPGRRSMRGARAICNWDEDALTIAVEAARSCVLAAQRAAQDPQLAPQSIAFCSTTAPFLDRDDAVALAAALDLPQATETLNLGASLRAGTQGLINALRRADRALTLLVASDARLTRAGSPQEMSYGDAAAALLLGPADPAALATVVGTYSLSSDFVDHYRMSGSKFDYALEERWVRDESLLELVPNAVSELLTAAGVGADAVRHLVLPTAAATAKRIAEACGLPQARRDERVLAECGDAGAALPLLMLGATLEAATPGELIVVVGIAQGVDALLLRAEPGLQSAGRPLTDALTRKREEISYVRYLSHRGLLDVDFGMRAERDQRTAHTVAYRKRGALSAFNGGRCRLCASVQFPLARVCVNPACRATDTQVAHRLADSHGRVKSFTEDWQAYAARPPYLYGNVEFAEGGNLLMEFTDIEPGELKVNDAVRFVYRIKDEDRARGFRRYFWKATTV